MGKLDTMQDRWETHGKLVSDKLGTSWTRLEKVRGTGRQVGKKLGSTERKCQRESSDTCEIRKCPKRKRQGGSSSEKLDRATSGGQVGDRLRQLGEKKGATASSHIIKTPLSRKEKVR